ncbi:hypothetical protein MSG28_000806 [Choristoneura fumiferana]|uniref:Uncharacterized protein n=1 Tax=Choristoneura fumiferana TaxID=7141 RepID=A0ACC0K2D2_CHOFU|nr:hypothetical protein MSG28_000806 [Choristoneura fumiferana]
MVLQVLIRLTVYIDQALVRSWLGDRSTSENVTLRGIDNMLLVWLQLHIALLDCTGTEIRSNIGIKAVRAALVLLPLLGITNAINMTAAPLDGSVWRFGLWCYGTHFLRSFQGEENR